LQHRGGLWAVAVAGRSHWDALTAFGAMAVTFMMVMYWFEPRAPGYILGFACESIPSSLYGFLVGAWPFGIVEVLWAGVAIKRYSDRVA
jgi:hypothetical protein